MNIANYSAQREIAELRRENARLLKALEPFVVLLEKADELRHESGSTALWRIAYDDLCRAAPKDRR